MTVSVLQLVKRKDADSTDIDSVDLMSLPIELQYDGWQQATPQLQGQSSVDDVITLLMNAGNDNALATALQSIDSKVKQIQWAQDPLNPVGVWLRSKLSGESNTRQSFILSGQRSPGLTITDPLAYSNVLQEYRLGLTRMPVWENVLASTLGGSAISANGGLISYSVAGDAHARVATVKLVGDGAHIYNEVWLGAKSDRYGVNPSNFVPFCSLVAIDVDSSETADTSTIGGVQKCVTTFGTVTTMLDRAAASVSGYAPSNPSDQRGKYTALLRAKTTNATLKVNVRFGQGFALSGSLYAMSYGQRLQIYNAATSWHYYPLGTVKIPAVDGFFEQSIQNSILSVAAEKISGTGNLEIDGFALIPAEHNIHVKFISTGYTTQRSAYIMTRPDQRHYAIIYSEDPDFTINESAPPDDMSWSLPSGSGVITCVSQGTYNVNTDQITPTLKVYPSYSSLRGSV